jgi:hypothetical protein
MSEKEELEYWKNKAQRLESELAAEKAWKWVWPIPLIPSVPQYPQYPQYPMYRDGTGNDPDAGITWTVGCITN